MTSVTATEPMKASELAPHLKAFFDKAVNAVRLLNNDYALQLLGPILKDAPECLEARQLARKAAIQKKGPPGKKLIDTGGLAVMKLQSKLKKDPSAVLLDLENILASDPYSIQANTMLFEAAQACSMPETATFALETLRQGYPENIKVRHKLAEHYMVQDMPEKAIAIYNEILKIDPTDGEGRKGLTNASARQSTKQQKWDKEETGVRSMMKDKKQAARLELESKQGMTKEQTEALLADYMNEYAQDQSNLNTVRKIAELLERLERWDEAYQYYAYAYELSNGDSALENKVHRLHDKIQEMHIHQLEEWVAANEDHPEVETYREELSRLRIEREESLIKISRERVDKNPTDPQLRFELGMHLFAAGHPDQAIPELQKARNNPHIRTKAMLLLAKCYDAKGMTDLAQRQLVEAAGELHAMDNTKKDVLYFLGHLYMKTGNKAQALEAWKQIYESDYGYKDVAKLVESSY